MSTPKKKRAEPKAVSQHGGVTVITDPAFGTPREKTQMVATTPSGVNIVTPTPAGAPVVTIGTAYGQGAPMQLPGGAVLPGDTPAQRAMQTGMRRGYLASQEPKAFLPVAAPHYAETTAHIAARNIAEQLLSRLDSNPQQAPSPYASGYLASANDVRLTRIPHSTK